MVVYDVMIVVLLGCAISTVLSVLLVVWQLCRMTYDDVFLKLILTCEFLYSFSFSDGPHKFSTYKKHQHFSKVCAVNPEASN